MYRLTHNLPSQIAKCIAIGFGSGALKPGPGTWGSLAAILVWGAVSQLAPPSTFSWYLAAGTTVIGLWAVANMLLIDPGSADPSWIVIDEWAGIFLALAVAEPSSPFLVVCAFALFRLFDIAKPPPISWSERLPGAYGVMADDLLAGLFAGAITALLSAAIPT